ncbi:MAG: hypothetical protein AAGG81_05505, partial [Chlamydiota bacterium]
MGVGQLSLGSDNFETLREKYIHAERGVKEKYVEDQFFVNQSVKNVVNTISQAIFETVLADARDQLTEFDKKRDGRYKSLPDKDELFSRIFTVQFNEK